LTVICDLQGTVHKIRPQSEGKGASKCGDFSDKKGGDSSDADVRTFWRIKNLDFWKFMVCPQEGDWFGADILQTRGGEDQFFAILCERLLWTAPSSFELDIVLRSVSVIPLQYRSCSVCMFFDRLGHHNG